MSTTTETHTTFYRVTTSMQKFYYTKQAFILFFSLNTIGILLQVSLFVFDILEVNGITHGASNEWIFWTLTFLSYTNAILGVSTNILVARENKNFIYFNLAGLSLTIINCIFSRSIMIAITMTLTMGLIIHRYFSWSKSEKSSEDKETNTTKKYIFIFISWLVWMIICLVIIGLWGKQIYDPNDTGMRPEWTWWLDGIGSSSIVLSMLLVTAKNKWGFIAQTFGTLVGVIIFLSLHQFIMIISLGITSLMSFTTFLAWVARDMEQKEK